MLPISSVVPSVALARRKEWLEDCLEKHGKIHTLFLSKIVKDICKVRRKIEKMHICTYVAKYSKLLPNSSVVASVALIVISSGVTTKNRCRYVTGSNSLCLENNHTSFFCNFLRRGY